MGALSEAIAKAAEIYAQMNAGKSDGDPKPQTPVSGARSYTPAMSQPFIPIVSHTFQDRYGDTADLTYRSNELVYTYITGEGALYWDSYAPETRKRLEGQLVEAGLLTKGGFDPGQSNVVQHEAWEEVLGYANYYGVTPFNALARLQREGVAMGAGSAGSGSGGGRRTVTTIPDYATIAQNAKNMLQRTLGRDMEDWEVALTADEMQRLYRKQAKQGLDASLAGSGEFEITDPGAVTQAFIDDTYSSELDRLSDVGEESANYKLVMDVFTKGAKMVGA